MCRFSKVLILSILIGCSHGEVTEPVQGGPAVEVEDGGVVDHPDREKADAFFVALGNVKTADEERRIVTDFTKWLKEKNYKVKVETKNGKHHLSCPYFPPVTPWTRHSFLDSKNLDLLPKLDDGE